MKHLLFALVFITSSAFADSGACQLTEKLCVMIDGEASTVEGFEESCTKFNMTWTGTCPADGFVCEFEEIGHSSLNAVIHLYDVSEGKAEKYCEKMGGMIPEVLK